MTDVSFTRRQTQICAMTVEGLTAKEIGRKLGISPRTVEDHRTEVYRKMDVHRVLDLVLKMRAVAAPAE